MRNDGRMNEVDLDLPVQLLPRIGGMATMPSRADSLRQALPSILPQVDRLYVYLDRHDAVPADLAAEPKIVALLPDPPGSTLGSSGKLLALHHHPEPCLFFGFDDDILYGAGYVDLLAATLRRYHHRCIAGLHGAIYAAGAKSYVRDRTVLHFSGKLDYDVLVDELGSGTIAFHSALLRPAPAAWTHPNTTDLMLMLEAIQARIPRVAARRPARLVSAISQRQVDSIYARTLRDDRVETRILHAAMRLYPDDWRRSA